MARRVGHGATLAPRRAGVHRRAPSGEGAAEFVRDSLNSVERLAKRVALTHAGVVKLVDALDSKSSSERSVGSSPTARTNLYRRNIFVTPVMGVLARTRDL